MKKYLTEFMQGYDYPQPAIDTILDCYGKVYEDESFNTLLTVFYNKTDENSEYFSSELKSLAETISVNAYTLFLTFLLCLTRQLKAKYDEVGIDEKVYFDTLKDLKYKLLECFEVDRVWGISPFSWFYNIFNLKIFALGRMEYNWGEFHGESATVASVEVKEGDMVLHVHIPSSGEPFNREARLDSYEKAYQFHKDLIGDKPVIFCCDSWLLNPENKVVLGEKSNISSFVDDFKIINQYVYPDKRNLWRIFGGAAELPPEQLPRDTSLRRKMADWLQEGNRLGGGKGIFLYDPKTKEILK